MFTPSNTFLSLLVVDCCVAFAIHVVLGLKIVLTIYRQENDEDCSGATGIPKLR